MRSPPRSSIVATGSFARLWSQAGFRAAAPTVATTSHASGGSAKYARTTRRGSPVFAPRVSSRSVGMPPAEPLLPRRNIRVMNPFPRRAIALGNRAPRVPALGTLTLTAPRYAGRVAGSGAWQAGELARAGEDRLEHRLGELAGERVLLARVVAAEQRVRADPCLRAVTEPRLRRRRRVPQRGEAPERRVPADRAQWEDHP